MSTKLELKRLSEAGTRRVWVTLYFWVKAAAHFSFCWETRLAMALVTPTCRTPDSAGHEVDGGARKKGQKKEKQKKEKQKKEKQKKEKQKKEKRDSSLRSRPSVRKTDGGKKSAAALGMTGVGYRSRDTKIQSLERVGIGLEAKTERQKANRPDRWRNGR